jgi:hypothetical protein
MTTGPAFSSLIATPSHVVIDVVCASDRINSRNMNERIATARREERTGLPQFSE